MKKNNSIELLNLYKRYLEQANQQEINIIGYHVNEHDNSGGHPDYVTNKHINKTNS